MFYVYNSDGLRFSGSLETLGQTREVRESSATQRTKFDEYLTGQNAGKQTQAASAYQKMLRRENMVEPIVHVYQMMSTPVSTISPNIPLVTAWQMLTGSNYRQLVVTGSRREVMGQVSDRDLLDRLSVVDNQIQLDSSITVRDLLQRETLSTDALSDIRRVAKAMAQFKVGALPVIEDGRLAGIVTRGVIYEALPTIPS
jgi:acetoin utilization protein AcuB